MQDSIHQGELRKPGISWAMAAAVALTLLVRNKAAAGNGASAHGQPFMPTPQSTIDPAAQPLRSKDASSMEQWDVIAAQHAQALCGIMSSCPWALYCSIELKSPFAEVFADMLLNRLAKYKQIRRSIPPRGYRSPYSVFLGFDYIKSMKALRITTTVRENNEIMGSHSTIHSVIEDNKGVILPRWPLFP